ncbi:MAG: hypothetical protein K6G33_05430 [Ruminococcus sp.]|uniref:hypothetical protein n=1 Tax=Ruminococcus sp. TaxID=41978 RepID=UPI0025EC9038|nr:hypothetical protein [Ruminococcus sp.]MCR5600166.1 hypothetical protein [Ruminococcus sp.]
MRFIAEFFHKRKRQKITVIAALLIVYSVASAGIFSYFHGSDQVTNRFSAEKSAASVTVSEPLWTARGQKMAGAMEAGMVIPKDPKGLNNGDEELYIRLKMTIELDPISGNLTSGTDNASTGELGIPTNERRNKGILDAIKINEASLFTNTGAALDSWGCSHGDYVWTEEGQDLSGDMLVFYFYYTAGEKKGEDDIMKLVMPGESTTELFTTIELPVYKHEFLGVFDQSFRINIQAEAVPASNYTEAPTVEEIITYFNSN